MSYLYGDSTPSPLEVNFVDFLRDSLDFCVELSLSTDGLQREAERGDALRSAARGDIDRLEKLGSGVALAVKSLSVGEGDSPTARCALAIIRSTSDRVRSDVQEVNAALETEEAKLEVARAGERQNCVKALGQLLLRHDLPESSATLTLKARANAPYAAHLRTASSLGVVATIELEVPSSDLFGHVVRVDRVLDRLEVQAPEVGGWLHKERKMRPQRLEKLHVIELELGAKESFIKLRAGADGSGPGFDVLVSAEGPRVSLIRVAERESPDPPFDVEEPDAGNLLALLQKFEAPAKALAAHRKALVQASLDDRPLRDHDSPTVLVERLVHAIAPVVREIALRSPSSTELVLKRLVGGGRREEIFVAKSELREKLDRLPIAYRALFDPLGLGDERAAVPSSATPAARPASGASPGPAPHANEPPTLVMARRASAPDTRVAEPPRPATEAPKLELMVEQIDAGFQNINLQDEKPTSD
jgi:hypothetical protein